MEWTCANCKNRRARDCEDYNWGYWDTKACKGNFELDIDTLSPKQREEITNLARQIEFPSLWDFE